MLKDMFGVRGDKTVIRSEAILRNIQANIAANTNAQLKAQTLSVDEGEMKALIAEVETRQLRAQASIDRLEELDVNLLKTQTRLNSLKQDFSVIAANQGQEALALESFNGAAQEGGELPTKEDADALVAQYNRGATQRQTGVPQSVLSNIQNSTGISPEEINQLLGD